MEAEKKQKKFPFMRANTIRWEKSFRRHEIDQEACSLKARESFVFGRLYRAARI